MKKVLMIVMWCVLTCPFWATAEQIAVTPD